MEDFPHIKFVANWHKMSGLSTKSSKVKQLLSIYLLLPILLGVGFLILLNFWYRCSNMSEFTQIFESFSCFGQLLIRKFVTLLHSSDFNKIIQASESFWKYEKFGKKSKKKFEKTVKTSFIFLKTFLYIGCVHVTALTVTPFFIDAVNVPIPLWIPLQSGILKILIWVSEVLLLCEIVFTCGFFDGLFYLTCTDLVIQLQMIKIRLKQIKIRTNFDFESLIELKKCFTHYIFLIKLHRKLDVTYSIFFIFQFLFNIGLITTQFSMLKEESVKFTQIFKSMGYIGIMCFQGALIYFPASNVNEENKSLCNQIYSTNWYNAETKNISDFISIWLLAAQHPLEMTGGGLFSVDRKIFLQVPKISFSISTILSR